MARHLRNLARSLPYLAVTATTFPAIGATYDCIIEPSAVSTVVAADKGIIAEVSVQRGDLVNVGDVLVRLQSDVERLQVELYRIQADNTVDIDSAAKRLELRTTEYQRASELESRNVASQTRVEETAIELALTELSLEKARIAKRVAELQVAQSEALLARRTVRSFVDGVVLSVDANPGEYANEQFELMSIASVHPLHVNVFLPVKLFDSLAVGDRHIVTQIAPSERDLEATVKSIDRVFDAASGTFGVLLEVANPDLDIPAGTRCVMELMAVDP